jgi:uncharacterized membrane protein SirB2
MFNNDRLLKIAGIVFLLSAALAVISADWRAAGLRVLAAAIFLVVAPYSKRHPERFRGPLAWGISLAVTALILLGHT